MFFPTRMWGSTGPHGFSTWFGLLRWPVRCGEYRFVSNVEDWVKHRRNGLSFTFDRPQADLPMPVCRGAMIDGTRLVRLLERRFVVRAPVEVAWARLEQVEAWPSWAHHIRRVDLRPAGPLTPDSEGAILLTNGIRSTFRMENLIRGTSWKRVGPFLWLSVHYDHQLREIGPEQTEITFLIDATGFGVTLLGRLFAAIYARNLDRAIPNLIGELEHK